ncbi:hypothetical protein GDO86_000008 [Hymenochirus boettgeri]|uniref:Uncharacterized protein n=1 Tax=Hymenochirus boettgeri TaxID=247094 RepID=A0A8T2KBC8_9PIPI|nr:hypothetical protein GDO86_000008 [Hymenochirus boettgeri]
MLIGRYKPTLIYLSNVRRGISKRLIGSSAQETHTKGNTPTPAHPIPHQYGRTRRKRGTAAEDEPKTQKRGVGGASRAGGRTPGQLHTKRATGP